MGWSPEQIAGRMELDGSEHAISAESIYRHACSPSGRAARLPRLLAQRKPKRGRRRRGGRRAGGQHVPGTSFLSYGPVAGGIPRS